MYEGPRASEHTIVVVLASTLVFACFEKPEADAGTSSTETSAGDGDGDATSVGDGDGDSTTAGDGDGDTTAGDGDGDPSTTDGDAAPSIVSFTVNGSVTPGLVELASAVVLEAEVADADGDIAYLVFKRDGEMISTTNGAGPSYSFEWVVSGAELNGEYSFEAEVYDSNDNMAASEVITLSLGMPQSGELDDWTHDSGEFDALYDVLSDAEGESVLLTGQTTVDLASQIRTDRVVGAAWADTVDADSLYGAAVTARDAGGYFIAGAQTTVNNSLDSTLYHYDEAGTLIDIIVFDASSQPAMADDLDNSIAAGRAPGGVWIMGAYNPTGGPNQGDWNTYIRRYTDGLDLEYSRFPSEVLAGRPFAYDMDVAADGSLALAGGQFAQMPVRPWFARFDEVGMVTTEVEIDDFEGGILHAIALGEDGGVVVGGQVTIGGVSRAWLRSYDSGGGIRFDAPLPGSELGVVAAVAIDPWGEVVSVSTEGCTLAGFRYVDCDLSIRKFDSMGVQMWEERYPNGFLGPNLLLLGFDSSLALDRYGYVYVTAIPADQAGTDWWARKLHP